MQADEFLREVFHAERRVYNAGDPTPLMRIHDSNVFVKREDQGPINAYKWRGAFNSIAAKHAAGELHHITCASAGNHAQGVAIAARKLDLPATIFMPRSTPATKVDAVKRHGNGNVDIRLVGDDYDSAAEAATMFCDNNGATFIHAFDDLQTVAGQATIAKEVIQQFDEDFDYAFLQIGGGGMAAGVSSLLKQAYPNIKIIGVEGEGQASMKASVDHGERITLSQVDTFADGSAVKRPGAIPFELCRDNIDNYMTVSNYEISDAIRRLWDEMRVTPEPSGAMGYAGLMKYAHNQADPDFLKNNKILTVITGANMDFSRLGQIAMDSVAAKHKRSYYRFHMDEGRGNLLGLLKDVMPDINVSDFMYGKTNEGTAFPVIAFEATSERIAEFEEKLAQNNIGFEDVTYSPAIRARVIPYDIDLVKDSQFYQIQFPERSGALRELLEKIKDFSEITYFNYSFSGESVGRALMAFETDNPQRLHNIIKDNLPASEPLDQDTVDTIMLQSKFSRKDSPVSQASAVPSP